MIKLKNKIDWSNWTSNQEFTILKFINLTICLSFTTSAHTSKSKIIPSLISQLAILNQSTFVHPYFLQIIDNETGFTTNSALLFLYSPDIWIFFFFYLPSQLHPQVNGTITHMARPDIFRHKFTFRYHIQHSHSLHKFLQHQAISLCHSVIVPDDLSAHICRIYDR